MRRVRLILAVAALMALVTSPVRAITFGQADGNGHPWIGAFVAEFEGEKFVICSGALTAPTVLVTAAHCTAAVADLGVAPDRVWVTFDSDVNDASRFIPATYHHNPLYLALNARDQQDSPF